MKKIVICKFTDNQNIANKLTEKIVSAVVLGLPIVFTGLAWLSPQVYNEAARYITNYFNSPEFKGKSQSYIDTALAMLTAAKLDGNGSYGVIPPKVYCCLAPEDLFFLSRAQCRLGEGVLLFREPPQTIDDVCKVLKEVV